MPEELDVLETKVGDKWQSLRGHCCYTLEEAANYVAMLDPDGKQLRLCANAEWITAHA